MAARSVWSPLVTGTTVAPNNFMRPDVRRLALHVHRAHVHRARQADARAGRGAGDAMLAGAGLGDDALRAEPLGEHRLAERVVDLVRAGVREILALEPHLRAPGLRQLRRVRERRGPAHPALELARELCLEIRPRAGAACMPASSFSNAANSVSGT